jgi:hypothetical protein
VRLTGDFVAIQALEWNLSVAKHTFTEHFLTLADNVLTDEELHLPGTLLEPVAMGTFLLHFSSYLRHYFW